MTCWWCRGRLVSVSVPITLTGLQTSRVNVHLGTQTRDDKGQPICILLGQTEEN